MAILLKQAQQFAAGMIQLDSSHPVETRASGNFRLHDPRAFSLTIGMVLKDFKQVFLELANQVGTALMKIHLFTSSPLLAASLGTGGLGIRGLGTRIQKWGMSAKGERKEKRTKPQNRGHEAQVSIPVVPV